MSMFLFAPEVEEIGLKLIETVERHRPLQRALIEYVFIDKAPVSKGRIVLGRARRMSGLAAFLLRGARTGERFEPPFPFFVIEISHNTWIGLDDAQRRALVDHELCHCVLEETEDGEVLSIRGHDFEEFAEIIQRHGLWSSASNRGAKAMAEQLALAIDDITDYVGTLSGFTQPPDDADPVPDGEQ